jgi:hypothetical protein
MKFFKFILVLLITVSITSCSETDEPAFELINANIAGTYKIDKINTEKSETATASSGAVVNLSTTTTVGDSFDDINIVINANGTYTASGGYRAVIKETPNGASSVTSNKIVVFEASGSYQLNITDDTITFNQQIGDFIEGKFDVTRFNQTSFTIEQENVTFDNSITSTSNESINLTRKE